MQYFTVTNFIMLELIGLVGTQMILLSSVSRIKFCEALGKSVNKFGAFPLFLLLYFNNPSSKYLGKRDINPLNTKRRLLYLKTQFVPRSKHFSSRL
jgi:hypothetical protein